MKVVSNTTPLLCMHKIGKLNLRHKVFKQVFVPHGVYSEIAVKGFGKNGSMMFTHTNFINVTSVGNKMAVRMLLSNLDRGEAEAIVLALELDADFILIDEKKGRRIAQACNKSVIGTIGVLQIAKNRGLISDMKSSLDAMISNGFWLDCNLYRSVLSRNNEFC